MRYNILKLTLAVLLLAVAVSCQPDEVVDIEFSGNLEQPIPDEEAKNYLAYESYIYWESTDSVRVYAGSAPDDKRTVAVAPMADKPRYGSIKLTGFASASDYYAIFPAKCAVDAGPSTRMKMSTSYTYRTDSHADFSFGTLGLPMVAWCGGNVNQPSLDFHSVCGIVRVQIYASSTTTVDSITFTECGVEYGMATHPISGEFSIGNIKANAPYLTPRSSASGSSITIRGIGQQVSSAKLLTFYLPLPALKNAANSTEYGIKMVVHTTAGSKTRVFKAKVRRNALSYLPAINIDKSGSAGVGMVGCGTEVRPFEIYSVEDLTKVREAYNAANGKINGVTVGPNTYFKVVRSDIELTTSNWSSGIDNFRGHFTYTGGHSTLVGISNTSNAPLFETILDGGEVDGVYMRGNKTSTVNSTFSPLCNINRGVINNCRSMGNITSMGANIAGICISNYGTITNSSNSGTLNGGINNYAAGICLYNTANGVIEGFNSTGVVKGKRGGTICYENRGTIQNSQVTLNEHNHSNVYGGVVYSNYGIIRNTEVAGVLITNDTVGGFCVRNYGTIDACCNAITLLQGYHHVGGIVAYMTGEDAEIRNCFNNGAGTADINAMSGCSGGIVGYLNSGRVYNCYCTLEVQAFQSTYYGVIAGRIRSGADVQNCYAGSGLASFYGDASNYCVKVNCFNPTSLEYCNVYSTATGSITSIVNVVSGVAVGQALSSALNKWVNTHGSEYLSWSGDRLPTFVMSGK